MRALQGFSVVSRTGKSVRVNPPFFLAPLAGLTDRAFREVMARRGGSGLFVTEMVSAEGFLRDPKRGAAYAAYTERQRPIACQIEGCAPARMAEAARAIEAMGMDIVDVNVGCPAPKITKGGAGSALLREPEKAAAVVRAMAEAVTIPVTVKMRIGWDEKSVNAVEVAQAVAEAGAAAVTVHGRTRAQEYRGEADWNVIARVAGAVRIPVVGNGDVTTPETLVRRYEEAGVAGVMVGRGAVMNPWIFEQARALYETGRYEAPSLAEKGAFILEHFSEMLADENPVSACRRFRSYMAYYTAGVAGGKNLRVAVNRIEDAETLKRVVAEFFLTPRASYGAGEGSADIVSTRIA